MQIRHHAYLIFFLSTRERRRAGATNISCARSHNIKCFIGYFFNRCFQNALVCAMVYKHDDEESDLQEIMVSQNDGTIITRVDEDNKLCHAV